MDDLISRQAALDALERIFDRCEEIEAHLPDGDPDKTGYKMFPDYMTVWKYLHQLPSAERREGQPSGCEYWDNESNFCTLNRPSAVRRGRWTDHNDEWDGGYYECSVCGEAFTFIEGTPKENLYNYCPNCGARMEE